MGTMSTMNTNQTRPGHTTRLNQTRPGHTTRLNRTRSGHPTTVANNPRKSPGTHMTTKTYNVPRFNLASVMLLVMALLVAVRGMQEPESEQVKAAKALKRAEVRRLIKKLGKIKRFSEAVPQAALSKAYKGITPGLYDAIKDLDFGNTGLDGLQGVIEAIKDGINAVMDDVRKKSGIARKFTKEIEKQFDDIDDIIRAGGFNGRRLANQDLIDRFIRESI